MSIISSNISIANRVEATALYFYNGGLSSRIRVLKPILQPIEKQIFSRIAGLFISPAALLDLAMHVGMLPFSFLYAIGKSVYLRKMDFVLPWQHLQRMRDAAFPILFGSLFGFIHPYLGTYAAEPTKKHIATGILLSGTQNAQFNTVCSPLTTMSEVSILLSKIPKEHRIQKKEKKLLNQVCFWEGEFEKIQSIDFFNLNITYKVSNKIQQVIDKSHLAPAAKECVKRISLLTYPIFLTLDLVVFTFATVVALATLPIRLLGGQSPAYLEKAWTPEVLIYNIIKIPLFIISSTLGFIVSLIHPKSGLLCVKYPLQWMAKIPFLLKLLGLKLRLYTMDVGSQILLPAVQTFSENRTQQRLNLLPSYGSHMRYLLIEKTGKDQFKAELIERGPRHGQIDHLSRQQMSELMENLLALRYKFGSDDPSILKRFASNGKTAHLGNQTEINNCIITNLFAAVEVLRIQSGNYDFEAVCKAVKTQALRRYRMYASDFYPFGKKKEVLEEINNIFHAKI